MSLTHDEFYKAANLTNNPFRTSPASEVDPRKGIWIGFDKEKIQLTKLLIRSRSDQVGNINFGLVYGSYGNGKSHSLLWSQYYIMQKEKDDFNSLVYYIPTLKKDKGLMSFSAAFIEDIVAKSNIINDIMFYKQFLDELIIEYKQAKGMGPQISFETVLQEILPSIELFNLAKEILKCDDASKIKFLLTPKGDYAAFLLFARLTNLFVFEFKLPLGSHRFKKAVYLFIDELDLLAECSAKEAREINDLIRHLYDACPDCFCMILAFTATSAELGRLFTEYVLDRVSKQIVLDYLQPDEAKIFVKEILDTARIDKTKNTGYYPFTEEAVQTIIGQIVSITPRKIVNMMQQVIEECRIVGIDPSKGLIDSQTLDQSNVWQEVT